MRSGLSPPMALLALSQAVAAAATASATPDLNHDQDSIHLLNSFDKRGGGFQDSFQIFIRKRNAHACMMSIVFIVLFPLAAISLHIPMHGVRVVSRIHAPIQILGLSMMIGAMGLGIDMALNDLHFLGPGAMIQAHVILGLIITSSIILVQPALGFLQHRHFRRTGRKSAFGHVHRWFGRVAICLGWVNAGLGFQLVGIEFVARSSLVREFVLMGVLGALWFALVAWDGYRAYVVKRDKLGSYTLGWRRGRGPVLEKGGEEEKVAEGGR